MQLQNSLTHFNITLAALQQVLTAALEKGANYADIFFEHTYNNYLALRDGAVNQASSDVDYGVGVRVVSGDQTGYAYTEKVTLEELLKAARTAACIATQNKPSVPVGLTEQTFTNRYPVLQPWEQVGVAARMPFIQRLNDRIFALDKRVIKVRAALTDSTSHILFCNSEGVLYTDYRPMAVLNATCIMEQEGRIENGSASFALRRGFEFLTDEMVERLSQDVVKKTAVMFEAVKPKGGEMPVVMAAGGSGILLHEAIGHAFEADFNRKNTSIFSDKLGKKICNPQINVVDDGTLEFNRGSINMDDEGVEGQKTYIVKDGILNSYLHDRISAGYYGVPSTGNGRRQSFRYAPMPRMRVTYMENGPSSEADIIAAVKKGIYVDNFTNGQVQIGAGDFTFFVKTGYLIENGRLTRPIKDINIIGNGPQALADITMVANNCKIDEGAWTCGKDGQGAPVSQGLPTVLVRSLTVGGEN